MSRRHVTEGTYEAFFSSGLKSARVQAVDATAAARGGPNVPGTVAEYDDDGARRAFVRVWVPTQRPGIEVVRVFASNVYEARALALRLLRS